MFAWIKTLGKPFMQGSLSFIGFGALTWGFIIGRVTLETYGPLVGLMIGFWFSNQTGGSK